MTPDAGLSNLCTSPKNTRPGLSNLSFKKSLQQVRASGSLVSSGQLGIPAGFAMART
eukprot:CAMPEP_0167791434 /NCGR_PEP_ID=MMETSP0111_2-20121227/11942_1 /TAXON_ID=91324 /ORGANISM="Lotharella globosa, Strain CCCM811" /LENGTH=56 /DNA_ID=CAMNT_0007684119 /DNA_START=795 /DNA_END=965 /DNA_ORIENTATION=-